MRIGRENRLGGSIPQAYSPKLPLLGRPSTHLWTLRILAPPGMACFLFPSKSLCPSQVCLPLFCCPLCPAWDTLCPRHISNSYPCFRSHPSRRPTVLAIHARPLLLQVWQEISWVSPTPELLTWSLHWNKHPGDAYARSSVRHSALN